MSGNDEENLFVAPRRPAFWLKGTWNPHDAYEKWRFFMHFVALFILFNLSLPSQDYFNWYNG
jgi:hypothetical protein